MKKLMFVMATLVAMIMNAQTFEPSKFIDNTYFRIEGGATALMHPHYMGYEDWGHSIQGVIGAEIGKWITPKFGVAFEGDFGIRNGSKFGFPVYEDMTLPKKAQRFNYITVTGLTKFNMSNIFAGWNSNRKVEFVLATGPMWIHGFPGKNYLNDFGVKFKAEVNFNVTERLQINIIPELNYNLTGAYSYGTTEHPRFDSRNAWYGLKAGVTYKIGNQFTECPYKYTQNDIDALNAEINKLRNQEPTKEIVTKIIEKNITNQYVVFFNHNSSELTSNAKSILDNITGSVIVRGGASKDGSVIRNEELANERAKVVADYLNSKGVKVLDQKGEGVTGSRAAIIYVK